MFWSLCVTILITLFIECFQTVLTCNNNGGGDRSNQGLTQIPHDLPNLPQIKIDLSFNKIHRVRYGELDYLLFIGRLDMKNNGLKFIDDGSFEGLLHLSDLGLSNNYLTSISSKTWNGLISLKFLTLSANNIGKLVKNTFTSLYKCYRIFLQNNR